MIRDDVELNYSYKLVLIIFVFAIRSWLQLPDVLLKFRTINLATLVWAGSLFLVNIFHSPHYINAHASAGKSSSSEIRFHV